MGFFNEIGNRTKALGDTVRLNAGINGERRKIDDYKEELGELTWKKFKSGIAVSDADILNLCNRIKASYLKADGLRSELEQIKNRSSVKGKSRGGAEKAKNMPPHKSSCIKCGAEISEGQKFCSVCGAKIPENMPRQRLCGSCGALLREEQIFCPECGKKYQ